MQRIKDFYLKASIFFMEKPTRFDLIGLFIFTLLILWHPAFSRGEINLFEVGLYLPGIQAILDGAVPYRDFFHLRGPLELWMPAAMMKLGGMHIQGLYLYFYIGNVACILAGIAIARELFRSRLILFCFALIFIGRTWPRVVYTYWGGMRYAFGLLSLYMLMRYCKTQKWGWMFSAGVLAAWGALISVEIGVYVVFGVGAAYLVAAIIKLQDRKKIFRSLALFFSGLFLAAAPVVLYLLINGAMGPYLETVWTIVTNMQHVIDPHYVSEYPRNFPEAFAAMVNPAHTNFKHLTPSYTYIFILVYFIYRYRCAAFNRRDLFLLMLSIYGFIMYNTGFRGLWAAQFEMALQPQKILMFVLLEQILMKLREKKGIYEIADQQRGALAVYGPVKWKIGLIYFCIFGLIGSSVGYAIARFNHRFFAFQYMRNLVTGQGVSQLYPLHNVATTSLSLPAAKGIVVPVEQAQELTAVYDFVQAHVPLGEKFYTFPELGTYHFLTGRLFTSRFPISTFAWFSDQWHAELIRELKEHGPRFLIVEKHISDYWKAVYLGPKPNRIKFQAYQDLIDQYYQVVEQTPKSLIYRRKGN